MHFVGNRLFARIVFRGQTVKAEGFLDTATTLTKMFILHDRLKEYSSLLPVIWVEDKFIDLIHGESVTIKTLYEQDLARSGKSPSIQRQFGDRVREMRQQKTWTQEEFSDICGLHRSHVGEIERGEIDIRLSTIKLIAETLGATASAMFQDITFREILKKIE